MNSFLLQTNLIFVLLVCVISMILLSKASDVFVDNAVKISSIWGLSEIVVGATIVSLGTTLPELSSSVIATLQGGEGFALGNAVGSVITNTSLVLGLGALWGKIPINRDASKRATILLFAISALLIPALISKIGNESGQLPQWIGFMFLLSVPVYIIILIKGKGMEVLKPDASTEDTIQNNSKTAVISIVAKIALSAGVVAFGAAALVASAEVIAMRAGIPDHVIASTIVAFGTSVPEVSTAITAAKRGYGGLALGNILGANILNILLVLGAAISISVKGMIIPPDFYRIHIPAMIVVLSVFIYFVYNKNRREISRKEGIFLILIYSFYLIGNVIQAF